MYHCIVCAGGEAQKTLEYLKEHEAETEKLLQDIVAIPSVSALPGMRPVCTKLPHVLPCKKHAQVLVPRHLRLTHYNFTLCWTSAEEFTDSVEVSRTRKGCAQSS